MKKMILSLVISAVTLCSCGVNVVNENKSESKTVFIRYDHNAYDNGYIYHYDDMYGSMSDFVDFDTLEYSPLCAVPNCNHNTSSCSAREIGSCPLLYNDYIYYFVSNSEINETKDNREFIMNAKLMKMKLNSSETQKVAEFHDCIPDTHDGFVVKDEVLYFQADDMNPQQDGYGNFFYSEGGGTHFLCSIDLSSGKYTNYGSIYDGDKQYEAANTSSSAMLMGIRGDNIYIDYSFMKEEVPEEKYMEEDFLLSKCFSHVVMTFDINNKTFTETQYPNISYVDGDYLAYYNESDNSVIIECENEEKIIPDTYTSFYALILDDKFWSYPDENIWYDLSDMSKHGKGHDGEISYILGYYNGKFIVKTIGMNFKALTEEELRAQ